MNYEGYMKHILTCFECMKIIGSYVYVISQELQKIN